MYVAYMYLCYFVLTIPLKTVASSASKRVITIRLQGRAYLVCDLRSKSDPGSYKYICIDEAQTTLLQRQSRFYCL